MFDYKSQKNEPQPAMESLGAITVPTPMPELYFPRADELTPANVSGLADHWRANHRAILKYLVSNEVPFFGLHGTPGENLSKVLQDREGVFQMATFYRKPESDGMEHENHLIRLYHAGFYCWTYSTGEPGGAVLVFNLEKDGENFTAPWEPLNTTFLSASTSMDTPEEMSGFSRLAIHANLLYRTGTRFERDRFDERFQGHVAKGLMEGFPSEGAALGNDDFSRILYRLIAQEVVAQALVAVGTTERRSPAGKMTWEEFLDAN